MKEPGVSSVDEKSRSFSTSYGSTQSNELVTFQTISLSTKREKLDERSILIDDHPEYGEDHPTTSLTRTFINLLKTCVGTGILAIPDGFRNAGILLGSVGTMLIGLMTIYGCHQLLQVYVNVAKGKRKTYSQVAYLVMYKAGGKFRDNARHLKRAINFFLLLTQIGLLCVYLLFTAQMIEEVVDQSIPGLNWSIQVYQSLLLIVLIPYCLVNTLHIQSYFSVFANLAALGGLVITLQYAMRSLQSIDSVDLVATNPSGVALFFGTVMFSFECVTFILPMENRMEDRPAFHGWNGLFSVTIVIVVCLYVFVGFYGYLAFGHDARMILSNLPHDDWLYHAAKLLYASAVFLSYNLQLYVVVVICYPSINRWVDKAWFDKYGEYIFRTCIVLITFGLSAGIPCLELMISFVGSIGGGSLTVIFPPILQIIANSHDESNRSVFTLIKSSILLTIGASCSILGAVIAMISIVNAMASPGGCSS